MKNRFYKNALFLKISIILFFAINVYAIKVSIAPDENISNIRIDGMDKQALKSYLKDTIGFVITEKGAKKVVKENRILANVYLKNHSLDSFTKHRIKVMIEDFLAKKMVDEIQRKIKINPSILKSYYYDHLQDFKKTDSIDLVGFDFPSYAKAVDFYYQIKNENIGIAKKLAKQKNIPTTTYPDKKIKDLSPFIQKLLEKNRENYFLPPLILGKHVKILYVASYHKAKGYIPFEKVKKKIKKLLLDQTFLKYRQKILNTYEKGEKH